MSARLLVVICDNHLLEAEAVLKAGDPKRFALRSFPARCGRPPLTWSELAALFADLDPETHIHLLGGCCLANLGTPPPQFAAVTVSLLNQCFYLFASRNQVDALIGQGAYLVTPGWLFKLERNLAAWGFTPEAAREFFRDSAKSIVLLDTGVLADGEERARHFADYAGLPLTVLPVGLDLLELRLQSREMAFHNSILRRQCFDQQRQAANAMMALSVFADLSAAKEREETINSVLQLFSLLFAPETLAFCPIAKDGPETELPLAQLEQDGFAPIGPGHGFWLLIKAGDLPYGAIKIERVAFPEYLPQYLPLALSVASICGLLLRNAILSEELLQAHKMEALATFAGGIAHDFNNLLGVIIGYAGMALEEVKGGSSAARFLRKVSDAGHRAKELVRQILILSPMQLEENRPMAVAPVIAEIVAQLRATLPAKIVLATKIAPECAPILATPAKIERILRHLCANGVEAMGEEGGTLTIALAKLRGDAPAQGLEAREYLSLAVADSGRGIDPAIMDKIFDPYYSTKEMREGAGMGLAVVLGLLRSLEGTIRVRANPEGGTTFQLFIPTCPPPGEKKSVALQEENTILRQAACSNLPTTNQGGGKR